MYTNKFHNYETCSLEVKNQINNIVNGLASLLENNLLGIYLNGSIVLDAFDENNSDIDIIGIVEKCLSPEEKIKLGAFLLPLHQMPCQIEVLLIVKEHIIPWQYPPVCHFYFSDYWLEEYKQFLSGENLTHRLLSVNCTDSNITSSVKIVKEKGICVYGLPIDEVFPDVPDADFWDSISYNIPDFNVITDNDTQRPYLILTLCRALSYRKTGQLFSKQEAANWALNILPVKFHPIILSALYDKYGLGEKEFHTADDALSFKSYIIEQINE